MSSLISRVCFLSFLCFFFGYANDGWSAVTIKVGSLPPKGSTWANCLDDLAKEVKSATAGEVVIKMYHGAGQGDEPDVLRKIRTKMLQAGVFTGKTLGEINGDVRVIEVPFTFGDNRTLAWKTLEKIAPDVDGGFKKKNFINLGYFEVGLVYLISVKKASSFEELKGIKIWSWQGDELSATLIKSMNLISTPLGLPDVTSSLTTGILEAAYASPLAILAMQWQTKVKYLINYPITYSIGALLVHEDTWNAIPAQLQKKVEELARKHIAHANELTIKENVLALTAIRDAKIEFTQLADKDIQQGKKIRQTVIDQLKGKLFSSKILDVVEKELR